jgi:hypothetical protein
MILGLWRKRRRDGKMRGGVGGIVWSWRSEFAVGTWDGGFRSLGSLSRFGESRRRGGLMED